jgi:hypothetical protein
VPFEEACSTLDDGTLSAGIPAASTSSNAANSALLVVVAYVFVFTVVDFFVALNARAGLAALLAIA